MMMAYCTGGIQRGHLQKRKQRTIYSPCDHSAGPGLSGGSGPAIKLTPLDPHGLRFGMYSMRVACFANAMIHNNGPLRRYRSVWFAQD